MSLITSRDLHIYRGTYKECMSQATEDMKFYFAWDTGEFFIGNKRGVKVKYGSSNLKKEEIERITDEKIAEFKTYQADIIINYVKNYLDSNGNVHELTIRMDQIESDLKKLQDSINALTGGNLDLLKELSGLPARVNSIDDDIRNIRDNIEEVNNRIDDIIGQDVKLENYYTKTETDEIIDEKTKNFISNSELSSYAKSVDVTSNISNLENRTNTKILNLEGIISEKSKVLANTEIGLNPEILTSISIDGNTFKLNDKVNLDGYIKGITGSDLAIGIANKTLNGLFIVTEENGAYFQGTIWYVNNGTASQISSGSGGGTKRNITTNISLSSSISLSQEINSSFVLTSLSWRSSNNSNGCALEKLTFVDSDGNQTDLKFSEESSGISSGIITKTIDRSSIRNYTFKLIGKCKTDTTTIDYTVDPEEISRVFSIYQPSFICVNDYSNSNQVHREETLNNKTFRMNVELNDKISVYVPVGKKASTNDIYTPIEKIGTVTLNINGINCQYDQYQTNALAKDSFDITILIQ